MRCIVDSKSCESIKKKKTQKNRFYDSIKYCEKYKYTGTGEKKEKYM